MISLKGQLKWVTAHRSQLALLCIFLLVSLPTTSRYLYNWDAGQFALGTQQFSLPDHQPHPPGYYLFLQGAKLLDIVLGDINASFISLNIIAAAAAIIILFETLLLLHATKKTAFTIALLFAINPVFWFYRSIAATYTFELLAVVILIYAVINIRANEQAWFFFSGLAVGLLAGFRPSLIIVAAPLLLWLWGRGNTNHRTLCALKIMSGLLVGGLLWFPFLAQAAGGLKELIAVIWQQANTAQETRIFKVNQPFFLFLSVLFALHLPLAVLMIYWRNSWQWIKQHQFWPLLAITVWQILFYLVFHFGETGYVLGIVPLFYILLIPSIEKIAQTKWSAAIIFCLCLLQTTLFLTGSPFLPHPKLSHLSWRDIHQHDQRIASHITLLKAFNPEKTLVIVLRGQYLNEQSRVASYPYEDIRVLAYYLPEYTLYDLLGVQNVYFTAHEYQYKRVTSNVAEISPQKTTVIFLADYINAYMLPRGVKLTPLYERPSIYNAYVGTWTADTINYNEIFFKQI